MGFLICMYLNLLETCINRFSKGSLLENHDIYKISFEFDYKQWSCVDREINCASHCLSLLIAKCKKLTMGINVDMYMSWCEVDYIFSLL